MKKRLFTLGLLSVMATQAFAAPADWIRTRNKEHRFYIALGGVYAVPLVNNNLAVTGIATSTTVTTGNTLNLPQWSSYMAGMSLRLAAGFMFNDNVGVEVGGQLGLSAKEYIYESSSADIAGYGTSVKATASMGKSILVTPALVLQNAYDKIDVYGKFGVAVPLTKEITTNSETHNVAGTTDNVYKATTVTTPKFTLGLYTALGLGFKVTDRFKIFAELNATAISAYAEKTIVTAYSRNGNNTLNELPESSKTNEYGKPNKDTGITTSKYSLPLSTFGGQIGVSFAL